MLFHRKVFIALGVPMQAPARMVRIFGPRHEMFIVRPGSINNVFRHSVYDQ